jgi:hypothetical protein
MITGNPRVGRTVVVLVIALLFLMALTAWFLLRRKRMAPQNEPPLHSQLTAPFSSADALSIDTRHHLAAGTRGHSPQLSQCFCSIRERAFFSVHIRFDGACLSTLRYGSPILGGLACQADFVDVTNRSFKGALQIL